MRYNVKKRGEGLDRFRLIPWVRKATHYPNCDKCVSHLQVLGSLKYRNLRDNQLFGLVSHNLRRHVEAKHR